MLRLLLWFWRYVIVGQPVKLRLFHPTCARRTSSYGHDSYAAPFCEHGLCSDCCDTRCKCLAHQVEQTQAERRVLAEEWAQPRLLRGRTG